MSVGTRLTEQNARILLYISTDVRYVTALTSVPGQSGDDEDPIAALCRDDDADDDDEKKSAPDCTGNDEEIQKGEAQTKKQEVAKQDITEERKDGKNDEKDEVNTEEKKGKGEDTEGTTGDKGGDATEEVAQRGKEGGGEDELGEEEKAHSPIRRDESFDIYGDLEDDAEKVVFVLV